MGTKDTSFYQQQASQLLKVKGKHKVTFNEDVNQAAEGSPDHILFQHYAMNKAKKGVMIKEASVSRTDYQQVSEALSEFKHDDDAKELFIPINLYEKHATHAYVKKTEDEKFIFEYSDPYGSGSPYGNPPKGLIQELENKFGKGNIIFKPIPTKQQATSESCFAINYQNMIDKYEGHSSPTIKPVDAGIEDPKIREVRLKMKQDLGWVYEQYDKIKEETKQFVEQNFPAEVKEREQIQNNLSRGMDVYDPEDYGHQRLAKAEVDKTAELLAKIDFSQAPSKKETAASDFPADLKHKIEAEGHKVIPLYDTKREKIIGYSVDINQAIPIEKRNEAANKIDAALPAHLKNNVIYLTYVTEVSKLKNEVSKLRNEEKGQPNIHLNHP